MARKGQLEGRIYSGLIKNTYQLNLTFEHYGLCQRPVQFFDGKEKVVAYPHNTPSDLCRAVDRYRRKLGCSTIYLHTLLTDQRGITGSV